MRSCSIKVHHISEKAPSRCLPAECRDAFPLEVLPRPIAEFAQAVSQAVGCGADYPAAAALAAMSVAIGAGRLVEVEQGWREQASLFLSLIGESGSGKTPSLRYALSPAIRLMEELSQTKDHRSVAVSEATVEALSLLLRENERGVLFAPDELSAVFDGFGAYRGGRGADRQFFLSCWSGEALRITRVNRAQGPRRPESIIIPRPFLTIAGGIQPCRLEVFGCENLRDIGLAQRFLFVSTHGDSYPHGSAGIPRSVADAYASFLGELARYRGAGCDPVSRSLVRKLTPDAHELFVAASEDFHRRTADSPDLRLYAPKLRAYLARFSLILHESAVVFGEQPDTVSEWTVAQAFELADYFLQQYRCFLVSREDSETAARVLRLMEAAHARGGELSLRQVYTGHIGGARNNAEAFKLLHSAARIGVGRIVTRSPKHGGRPQTLFILNRA
ncbi:MAG: YfjI family protein [Bryobacteraceae bacterium]|nr:YfjI family protein [Bryobacteraceae bacterium]